MTISPQSLGRPLPSLRVARIAAHPALVATMVAAAAGIAHLLAALDRLSPRYLPDEFLYSQLARSLGNGDGVAVLGQPSPFPALLEPLVTAALWIPGNAELAYRLTQSLHAVAMSAAAIPIYVLARRLGLSSWSAVTAVAISAVAPGLVYVGYLTADATGYLFATCALLAGTRALERGSKRSQVWFLVLTAAAVSARAQYVVLILAFVAAATILERGRLIRAARRLPVVSVTLVLAVMGALVAGPSLLGRYQAIAAFSLSWDTGRWIATTVLLLTIGTGVVIVPGAAAWLGATLARPQGGTRPQDRSRAAFAALGSTFVLSLIVATAVISVSTGSERFLERYLIVLVPVLALAFLCWIEDGRPWHYVAGAIAAALVALAAIVPLSGYAEGQGRADSPTLLAVSRLSEVIGIGSASLAAALAVTVAALVAAALALSPRMPAQLAAGTALVLLVSASIGAHAGDLVGSQRFQDRSFLGSPRWVDRSGAKDVLLVQTPGSGNESAMITSFWNTSVTRVTRLGNDVELLDGMGAPLRVTPLGALTDTDRHPIAGPVLFATSGTAVLLSDDASIVADRTFALVRSPRPLRLVGFGEGIRSDGRLAMRGRLTAYPTADGRCSTVTVRLVAPKGSPVTTIRLRQGGQTQTIRLRSGETGAMSVTSARTRGRSVEYEGTLSAGGAIASLRSLAPSRLSAQASECSPDTEG